MAIIIYKKVKRCKICGHLIQEDAEVCPYCSGQSMIDKSLLPKEDLDAYSGFEMPTFGPKAKKAALISAACVALIVLGTLVFNWYQNSHLLDRSIFTELTEDEIDRVCEDESMAEFRSFYHYFHEMIDEANDDELANEFKSITYKQLWLYSSKYADNSEFITQTEDLARENYVKKYVEPINDKLESEITRWKDFIAKHDISSYLKVTPVTSYINSYWGKNPAFYFQIDYKSDSIQDCVVHGAIVNNNSGYSFEGLNPFDLNLYNITSHSSEDEKYSYSVDRGNVWDYNHIKLDIQSVTLTSGEVIYPSDMDSVPTCITNYLTWDVEDSPTLLLSLKSDIIRALIDSEVPEAPDYVKQECQSTLKAKDPLCFDFTHRVNNSSSEVDY